MAREREGKREKEIAGSRGKTFGDLKGYFSARCKLSSSPPLSSGATGARH